MALQVKFPFRRLLDVFVTHVDEVSGNFFIQIIDAEAGNLDELMAEIEEYVKREPKLRPADITVGDIYIAQYTGDWYRARVLDVKDQCEVFFVDYGNTDIVHADCVRKAKGKFLELPPQAFECEMDGIENVRGPGFQDSISSLKECILEQELVCRGVSLKKNNVLVVNLYTDKAGTTSVMGGILSAGLESRPAKQLDMKYKMITLQADTFHDLCVTHVQDPGHFWCQLLSNAESLQELMDDLASEYNDTSGKILPDLVGCSVSRPCCAKFAEDESWYRAIITNVVSLASGLVEVRFVDYGNTQKTPLADVKELKAGFQDLPVQAVECMVGGIQPVSGENHWSVEAMTLFSKLIKDKHVVGLASSQESNGRHQLKLFDTTSEADLEVNQVLIAAGYAAKADSVQSTAALKTVKTSPTDSQPKVQTLPPVFATEIISPSVEEKVLVTTVDSPSLFYCQLFRNSPKLVKLMKDINQHYSRLSPTEELLSPSPGDPCCAQFSEDGCWYRAIAKEVSSGKAKVLYVDYGNSESLPTKKIKRLLPRFSELPKQGVECSLNRIRANGRSWRENDIKKFQAMTDGEAKMTMIAQDEDGISRVELVVTYRNEEKNASEEFLLDGSAQLIQGALPSLEHFHEIVAMHDYPVLTLTIGQYEDVIVSFTEDPCNFWCQLMKSANEHSLLMKEIEDHYTSAGSKDALSAPSLGMPCCAQFTEDNVWYRGKIRGMKKGKLAEIHFVDYGNSEVLPLSRTRPIKPEFMRLGPQAVKCTLSNITPPSTDQWLDEAIQRFEELTMDKDLILRADSYDKNMDTYTILLLDNSGGKNLSVSDELAPLLSQKVGVDIPSLVIKEGTQEIVYVTSVTCKEKFYCQIMKTVAGLDELMNKIENHYAPLDDMQGQLNKPVVGTFCAAKYALDDGWYRAKIVGVHEDSVSLHYIDYGNSETVPVSRVKALRPEFATLPSQVFECTLGRSAVGFSDDQFKDLVFDKEFKAKAVAIKGDGLVEVELLSKETGRSVTELLEKKGAAASPEVPCFKLNVGEQKMVYISAVECVSKFFCQVTEMSESLDELMNKLECHYISLADQVEALPSPKVGSFCVAKFTDDQSWYRAKITSISENHVKVLYIDYGNTETLPQTRLKVLQPELAALPAQALCCSLSRMSGSQSDQVDRKFSELACDQVFESHVILVRPDGVMEVELYSKSGVLMQDMLGAETQASHAGTVPVKISGESSTHIQLKPETLTVGEMEEVFCVSANSPLQFWCQLESRTEEINQLMADMNSHYEGSGAVTISYPAVCTVCCAKFSGDGNWYRGRVDRLCGGEVEVQFVDYGNSERMAAHEIKVLDGCFTSLPVQAVECSLADILPANNADVWSDEAAAAFEEITFDRKLSLVALGTTAKARHEVMLSADGVDVASQLASLGYAQALYEAAGFKPQACVKVDGFLDLYPTVCHSPAQFYCQVMSVEQIAALKELMDQLQEHCNAQSENEVTEPRVGMSCAVKFTDGNWHRATITKVLEQNSVELYYVDYGNHDTAPMDRVQIIDRRFMALEAQAICCSISIATRGTDWAEAVIERFTDLVLEKQLVGKVLRIVSRGTIVVELFDTSDEEEDVNITKVLMKEGMSSASDAQKVSQEEEKPAAAKQVPSLQKLHLTSQKTVFVCAVESPGLFFCQFVGTEEKLATLLEDLTSKYNAVAPGELSLNSIAVGDLCCAKFSEDGSWYRAVVEAKVSSNKVTARFIDYGNKEDVDVVSIKSLKQQFLIEPALAVQCCLTGLKAEDSQLWPEEVCIQFEEMTTGKELVVETKSTAEPYEVDLLDGGVSISEELLKNRVVVSSQTSPGRGKQVDYIPPSVGVGDTFNVFITSIVSPGKFYCQLVNLGSRLDEVMNQLNNHYIQLSETEGCLVSPFQGQPCVALYSVDNMWYRAKVMSLSVNNLAVQFVDYGNSETICPSGVKQIQALYTELPAASVECSLDLSQEAWTAEQSALFEELTGEKELTVKLLLEKDGRFEVKVYDEGVQCISDNVLEGKLKEQHASKPKSTKLTQLKVEPEQKEEIYVSHVNSTDSFYVQLCRTSPQLDQLMHALADVSSESLDCLPQIDLQVGMSCCALFAEDNAWYRAEVTKVQSELEAVVQYVDYGNTASLLMCDVKVLGDAFSQLPRQAVHCHLNCSKDILQSIDSGTFEGLVVGKPLTATFVAQGSGKWAVDLQDDGKYIVDFLKGESTSTTAGEKSGTSTKQYQDMILTPGQTEAVFLSSALEPKSFHVQMSRNSQDLEDLMKEISRVYTLDTPVEAPQVPTQGTPCCAMYLEDGSWYRAEIIKVLPDSQLEVEFVDYGNSDVVPAKFVKELMPEFLKQPKHSVHCKLAVSKTAYNEVDFFHSLDLDKALQATFSGLEEGKWLVRFEDGDGGANTSSQPKTYSKPSLASGSNSEMLFLYAESPSSLYLQRTDNPGELDKLMSSIPTDLPKGSPSDLVVGLPCLGQFTEDDAWYRAEILTVDGDKACVQYVDYGNSEWLQIERLHPIREEYLSLPVQAIRCSLDVDNVAESTKFAEALNSSLAEKVLRVEVLRKTDDDDVYTVQLFEPGSEQPVIHSLLSGEGTQNALEEVPSYYQKPKEYRRPILQKGSRVPMYYIAAQLPGTMHLQFVASENELNSLMSEVACVYSGLSGEELQLVDPQVAQPCCAQFSEDEQWYRAEFVATGADDMVTVKFIDYGNCDIVHSSKVKELKEQFLDLQVQAVECKLSGMDTSSDDQKWTEDCLVKLDELCASKKFSVEIIEVEGIPSVTLCDENSGETINELLVSCGHGVLEQETVGKDHDEQHQYQMPRLNAGDRLQVYCTLASSPHLMLLQLKDDQEKLTAVMGSIASVYKTLPNEELQIANPRAGQACCAKFSEDDEWYRAQVVNIIDGDHINVKFVDFGNSDVVPASHVKQLNADFQVLPIQSFACRLAGICASSQDGVWSEHCVSKLQEVCTSEGLVVEIVKETEGSWVVNLFDESQDGKSVATDLMDLGYAKFDLEIPHVYSYTDFQVGSEQDFFYASGSSPNSFWCQPADSGSELSSLMERISKLYTTVSEQDLTLQTPDVGTMCCAKSSEDNGWHRAEVSETLKDATLSVHFVDYGNSENVQISNVKELVAEFRNLPVQAVECALSGIEPLVDSVNGWSLEAIKQLEELCIDKTLLAKITEVCGRKLEVNLQYIEDGNLKSINQDLISDGFARAVSTDKSVPVDNQRDRPAQVANQDDIPRFQSVPLSTESKVRVTVSHVASLSLFYCQLVDPAGRLDILMENMAAHYCFPNLEHLASVVDGQACCAQFTQDDTWYRATVLTAHDTEASVLFVDYGNSETLPVSRIKKLCEEFMVLPSQAVECAIHGVCPADGAWPEEVKSYFEETVADKELDIVIVDTIQDCKFEVLLFLEGENLSELILQKFSEKVCLGLARGDVNQVTDEKDEGFQDAGKNLSPSEDQKESTEMEMEVKASDESEDEFQDTRETFTPPKADQEFERIEKEEKEPSDEAAAKQEVKLEESTQAAIDADPGEDSEDEFLEASEIVHDVKSEENLTALTGGTPEDSDSCSGTHEGSKEERDAVECDNAGSPAPLLAVDHFIEQILDEVCASVGSENIKQADECHAPLDSTSESVEEATSQNHVNEEEGTESSVEDKFELSGNECKVSTEAEQQDLEDSMQQLSDADFGAKHTEGATEETPEQEASVREFETPPTDSEDFGPEATEGSQVLDSHEGGAREVDYSDSAKDTCEDTQQGSDEDQLAAGEAVGPVEEQGVSSKDSDSEMLKKPSFGGDGCESEMAEVLFDREGDPVSEESRKELYEKCKGEMEGELLNRDIGDSESKPEITEEVPDKELQSEGLIGSTAGEELNNDLAREESKLDKLENKSDLVKEDLPGDEHTPDVKGEESDKEWKPEMAEVLNKEVEDEELKDEEAKPETTELSNEEDEDEELKDEEAKPETTELSNEEDEDEESKPEVIEEVSNKEDEDEERKDEKAKPETTELSNEEHKDEESKPEMTELLNKEDEDEELKDKESKPEVTKEVSNEEDEDEEHKDEEAKPETTEEVSNKEDEDEEFTDEELTDEELTDEELTDKEAKPEMTGEVSNEEDEDEEHREKESKPEMTQEVSNEELKDEEAKPEMTELSNEEDEDEELKKKELKPETTQEVSNEEDEDEELTDEELTDEELTDEELTDEELTDEELTDEELTDEESIPETTGEVSNEELRDKDTKPEMTEVSDKEDKDKELREQESKRELTEKVANKKDEDEELREQESTPEMTEVLNEEDKDGESKPEITGEVSSKEDEDEEFKRKIEEEMLDELLEDEKSTKPHDEQGNMSNKGCEGAASKVEMEEVSFKKLHESTTNQNSVTSEECESLAEEDEVDKDIQQNGFHHHDDEVNTSKEEEDCLKQQI